MAIQFNTTTMKRLPISAVLAVFFGWLLWSVSVRQAALFAVGILVFNEPFSLSLVAGVALIAASVVLVMLGKQVTEFLQRFRHA